MVRRYRAEQRAATRVRTRWSSRLQEAGRAVIRLLCIHRAFYAVTRRRSSPGQGVSGLSLSRRNEGLKVGSRYLRRVVGWGVTRRLRLFIGLNRGNSASSLSKNRVPRRQGPRVRLVERTVVTEPMDILKNRLSVPGNGGAFPRSKYAPRNNSGVPRNRSDAPRNPRIVLGNIFAPRKGPTVSRNAEPVPRTTNGGHVVPGLYPLASLCTDGCC